MKEILFCDTNIVRYILDDPSRADAFVDHVNETGFMLALSLIQVVELTKLTHYHVPLANLIFALDTHIFAWWKLIVAEEAERYPARAIIDPLSRPSICSHYPGFRGKSELALALSGNDLALIWTEFEEQKTDYEPIMAWLPSTLPSKQTEEVIDIDFKLHNFGVVLQMLRQISPEVVNRIEPSSETLGEGVFPGAYVHASYIYYRYILKGMKPQRSDVPDLHQVFYIPYCRKAIVEKSMAGILHQLKRERGLLPEVDVQTMKDMRSILG